MDDCPHLIIRTHKWTLVVFMMREDKEAFSQNVTKQLSVVPIFEDLDDWEVITVAISIGLRSPS